MRRLTYEGKYRRTDCTKSFVSSSPYCWPTYQVWSYLTHTFLEISYLQEFSDRRKEIGKKTIVEILTHSMTFLIFIHLQRRKICLYWIINETTVQNWKILLPLLSNIFSDEHMVIFIKEKSEPSENSKWIAQINEPSLNLTWKQN